MKKLKISGGQVFAFVLAVFHILIIPFKNICFQSLIRF